MHQVPIMKYLPYWVNSMGLPDVFLGIYLFNHSIRWNIWREGAISQFVTHFRDIWSIRAIIILTEKDLPEVDWGLPTPVCTCMKDNYSLTRGHASKVTYTLCEHESQGQSKYFQDICQYNYFGV